MSKAKFYHLDFTAFIVRLSISIALLMALSMRLSKCPAR
jgi:hypothetical protein